MIPIRLYMRNFMCYREQALDLDGIHLACLTGNNGHGKSAILDAMTWALWGYSRVGARRDDELIHLGQEEMEVEFEFCLSDGRQGTAGDLGGEDGSIRYRVLRKRSARKRGKSDLELQGWDAEEKRFRSLSEPTIALTQHKIDDLLHMDYETFINSAFLLQGRADEFTIKRPGERKQVLGEILNLQAYDRYEKLAKEKAQEIQQQADQRLATIEQIDRELAREPEYERAVRSAEGVLAQAQDQRAGLQKAHDGARAALQEAEAAQRQLDELERRIAAERQEVERLDGEIDDHRRRLHELEGALAEGAEIERSFAAYQQAVAHNEALNAKLAELVSLNERRSEHERRIDAARHELEVERYAAAEQVQQLRRTAQALDQEPELLEVQASLSRLQEREAERERAAAQVQQLAADVAALEAENRRAERDAEQIKEKIDLLATREGAAPGEEAQAHCPLCGQGLAAADSERLLNAFQEELEEERDAYRRRLEQIRECRVRIQELQSGMDEIGRELRQRSGLQRQEVALSRAVEEARQAGDALPQAEGALAAIERRLEERVYAPQAWSALRQIEGQLSELGYDADAHRQVQTQIEAMRPVEVRMQTLREARSGVETVRLALAQLSVSRAEAVKSMDADRARAESLAQLAGKAPELRQNVYQALQALERAHDQEQRANLELGAARNRLEHCADLRQQRIKREREEGELRQAQGIYEELRRALGKNGVQAMLIESAIPEIEQEANHLLARMTRGAMQVRFETQRDTKSGSTIETLDIHISDELGTRAYETYSGGERYRINFAIRIALSRLLARRAGAQLRMLVIDEGFGTQDNQGRDGLIDAIHAIQDDFACILVITHIEELKDAFNVRIEVEKTPEGSQITVV
jgi:exonuclease SbcC